jgi:CRP-like cAMP-binding protein
MSSLKTKNSILQALTPPDLALVEPYLDRVDLPVRTRLETRNARISTLYFIESGIASVVSTNGRQVEVGMVGSEGMTGASVALFSDLPVSTECYMQLAGEGFSISAEALRSAMDKSPSLHRMLLRFVHQLYLQTQDTALANVTGSMEQRLARWLLMVHDRAGRDLIPLTHEFMAVMLGVQRSGVSLCLQGLEKSGAIEQHRGSISVQQRRALLDIAKTIYHKERGPFEVELAKKGVTDDLTSENTPT